MGSNPAMNDPNTTTSSSRVAGMARASARAKSFFTCRVMSVTVWAAPPVWTVTPSGEVVV